MTFSPLTRTENVDPLFKRSVVASAILRASSHQSPSDETVYVHGLSSGYERELFADWFTVLVKKYLHTEVHAKGPVLYQYKNTGGIDIKMSVPASTDPIEIGVAGGSVTIVDAIAMDAIARAQRRDRGASVWWKAKMHSRNGFADPLHMVRVMGQHKCYQGAWVLGQSVVFLTFPEGPPKPGAFMPVPQEVEIFLHVPGPGHGLPSERAAQQALSRYRALLAFALGVPLRVGWLFEVVSPEDFAQIDVDKPRRHFPVDNVPIWPQIAEIQSKLQREGVNRLFGSLMCYEVAMSQTNGSAALVFFVMAIEALTVPSTRTWRGSSKRFQSYLLAHCKESLEKTLCHGNFKQAFGEVDSVERLAELLYELRSEIVHTGALTDISNIRTMVYDHQPSRIMLVASVARDAIRSFLDTPSLSSPPAESVHAQIRLQLSKTLLARLAAEAGGDGGNSRIEQWLLRKLKHEYGD